MVTDMLSISLHSHFECNSFAKKDTKDTINKGKIHLTNMVLNFLFFTDPEITLLS